MGHIQKYKKLDIIFKISAYAVGEVCSDEEGICVR
jgi:hypothetical protein